MTPMERLVLRGAGVIPSLQAFQKGFLSLHKQRLLYGTQRCNIAKYRNRV